MKQYFLMGEIPEVLDNRPLIDDKIITASQVETISEENVQAVFPVVGDCMERAGIENGGWVAVDFSHMPRAPKHGKDGYIDACLCLAVWPETRSPTVMVKAYSGRWGAQHMVSTRYDNWKDGDYRMDVGLFAEEIYGVIFACWDRNGKMKWHCDPAHFPTKLPLTSAVHGGDVGTPVKISEVRL